MKSVEVEVRNEHGLHARPAALFVRAAAAVKSTVTVQNLTTGKPAANAKSIMAVLASGIEKGHRIRLVIEGPDEATAAETLESLVASGLGEGVSA